MREKKVVLFLACLGMSLMVVSIYSLYISESNRDVVGSVFSFAISAILSLLAIIDYDYMSKKEKHESK
jgi:hypothetical protein